MNVLSTGLPFGTPGEPIRHFASRCGHAVRTLAAEGDADYSFTMRETAQEVIARISREWTPELLVCWAPEVAPPPRAMETCPIRTAAMVSDWTVYYAQLERNLPRYDIVVTDRLGAESAWPPGIAPVYLGPMYSHRTGIHRDLGLPRDIDIAFAGNLNHAVHYRRGRLLDIVAGLSDRYRVVIASELPPEDYTRLLSRARIVFNHALRGEMNLRCFEAIACGALLFIEEDNLEVPEVLRDREEVVLYRPANLVGLLEHYLAEPAETARLAQNAHARTPALAGEARLDAILDALAKQSVSGRPFQARQEPEKTLADVMQYASSRVADQRAYARQCLDEALQRFPGEPVFQMADACAALEDLAQCETKDRGLMERVFAQLRGVVMRCPESVPAWLNLAFVARRGGSSDAEARFLEHALSGSSCVFGELLLGERRDPYSARYREALAFGAARIELLWAAAAARLAALRFSEGDLDTSREWAARSIAWEPDIPGAYRVLARIERSAGRLEEAAGRLEESLRLSSLDSEHRAELVDLWRQLGRRDEAHALAQESLRIFSAWWGAEHAAAQFRALVE